MSDEDTQALQKQLAMLIKDRNAFYSQNLELESERDSLKEQLAQKVDGAEGDAMKRKSGKRPYSQLEKENEDLRDGFELIMEILEDLGFLEPQDPDNVGSDDEDEEPRRVIIVNPEPAGIAEPKE